MKNVTMTRDGNKLIITVDLSAPTTESSSGKSLVIASTEGNQSCLGDPEIKVGVNVYKKK